MAAVLSIAPTPAEASSVVAVLGTGFANAKTRLLLDGVGATTNIFRPKRDGSFAVGITVSATSKVLLAQQLIGGAWKDTAKTPVTVGAIPVAADIYLTKAAVMWHLPEKGTGWVEYGAGLTTPRELSFTYADHQQTLTGIAGDVRFRVVGQLASGAQYASPWYGFTTGGDDVISRRVLFAGTTTDFPAPPIPTPPPPVIPTPTPTPTPVPPPPGPTPTPTPTPTPEPVPVPTPTPTPPPNGTGNVAAGLSVSALQSAIQANAAAGKTSVLSGGATYTYTSSLHLTGGGITIDMNGATIHCTVDQPVVQLDNCQNFSIDNGTIQGFDSTGVYHGGDEDAHGFPSTAARASGSATASSSRTAAATASTSRSTARRRARA
jgi:hypothetical protein